jgi:hypothetical protein
MEFTHSWFGEKFNQCGQDERKPFIRPIDKTKRCHETSRVESGSLPAEGFLSSKLALLMWERHLAATGSRLEAAPTGTNLLAD